MGIVTVDTNNIEVYGDLPTAKIYVAGLVTPAAAAWRLLLDNEKARYMVAAKNYIDRQFWQGVPTFVLPGPVVTTLQFPRTGLLTRAGAPVDSTVVPPNVVTAEFELSVLLLADPTIVNAVNTGSNLKTIKAGPVDAEFFKPTIGILGNATKLPTVLMDLIGIWLGSISTQAGIVSGNVDDDGNPIDTAFDTDAGYTRNGPF